ncbi:hypothetical protein Tsubulata_023268, partial [Turnera subulata]
CKRVKLLRELFGIDSAAIRTRLVLILKGSSLSLYVEVGAVKPALEALLDQSFDVGKGLIRDGTGFATFPVKYQCVVFRLFKGEILEAVVTMVNKMGFFAEAGPYRYYMSSTPREVSSLPRGEDNQPLEIFSGTASINDSNPTPSATQTVGVGNTAVNEGDGADTHFQKKKRAKKSVVWLEFTEETINGQLKALCNH